MKIKLFKIPLTTLVLLGLILPNIPLGLAESFIYVPDNYVTIQAAVNAANSGDTIIVRDGTYIENIIVNKTHLTIKSENGATSTIIQAPNSLGGVFEVVADHVEINGFTIKDASTHGIYLYYADYSNIINNNVFNNYRGIYLYHSSDNNIINNNLDSNTDGILLEILSKNNTIYGNNVFHSKNYGIFLGGAPNSYLRNNSMVNNGSNFNICCSYDFGDYNQDIDTSNTVNGKPIYYLVNKHDEVIDAGSNAGYIGIVNSTNMIVKNLTIEKSSNREGILFVNTKKSRIENVHVLDSWRGIYLYSSNNNIIQGSYMSNNGVGIYLDFSSNNNIITGNNISDNSGGIHLHHSSFNTINNNDISNRNLGIGLQNYSSNNDIVNNEISNNSFRGISISDFSDSNNIIKNNILSNGTGVYFYVSSQNLIYHNNFIDNPIQTYTSIVYSFPVTNLFDNGYPEGGNYWSDYDTSEEDCIDANNDGFCDAPYIFTGGQDNYPFVTENGWEVPVGQPIPGIVLDAEGQLFQTANDALTAIDNIYIEMVMDTAIDIGRDIFAEVVAKAVNKIIQIDTDVPLRERGPLEGMRALGTKLATELIEPIPGIIKENLVLEGIVFPEQIKVAHEDFIGQRVNLSSLADLDLIIVDISDKKVTIGEVPISMRDFKINVFDKIEYAEEQGQRLGTYIMWGGRRFDYQRGRFYSYSPGEFTSWIKDACGPAACFKSTNCF